MNKAIKRRWIKWLRSGKVKQGKASLAPTKDTRCCLGVLCDIAVRSGVIKTYKPYEGGLPLLVRKWAGLTSADPVINHQCALSVYNDGISGVRPRSFNQIANLIERYL